MVKVRVSIFDSCDPRILGHQINNFIEESEMFIKKFELIDIKYANVEARDSAMIIFTAMIVFRGDLTSEQLKEFNP